MQAFKQYGWVLFLIGAAILLALTVFLFFEPGQAIVVPFVGAIIVLTSVIRLVPYVKTQRNDLVKTVNIIEITIDVLIGLTFLFVPIVSEIEFGIAFGIILGIYLMLRGTVHFFGVSERVEQSDLPIFFYHIATLIIGSYVAFSGFDESALILVIQFFSVVAGGYLSWSGYKGYRQYRYQKTLYMGDQVAPEAPVEKRVPDRPTAEKEIEEPVQDHVS
jgi:uncharacterized membrane protein HdeD (DUF308 family)